MTIQDHCCPVNGTAVIEDIKVFTTKKEGKKIRVTTTDPISGNEVLEIENAPFVIEGSGDDALKIYFELEENKASYTEIESKTPQKVLLDIYNKTKGTAREM